MSPKRKSWKKLQKSQIPDNALIAGRTSEGDPIYIGRLNRFGDHLICRIHMLNNQLFAFVTYYLVEYTIEANKEKIEIFCDARVQWVPSFKGNIPVKAIAAGATGFGEKLYIGRTRYMGSLTVGKIHPSHKAMYFGYRGIEVCCDNDYEILTEI